MLRIAKILQKTRIWNEGRHRSLSFFSCVILGGLKRSWSGRTTFFTSLVCYQAFFAFSGSLAVAQKSRWLVVTSETIVHFCCHVLVGLSATAKAASIVNLGKSKEDVTRSHGAKLRMPSILWYLERFLVLSCNITSIPICSTAASAGSRHRL